MEALGTKKLRAIVNPIRQLLLRLIYLDKDINIEKLNSHIKIDKKALMYHINILKDADLVKNNTFNVDDETRTVYNINKRGRGALAELGFDV